MAGLFEANQVGKREELMALISNIEAAATPFSSMLKVVGKPNQKLIQYQAEAYGDSGHAGVMDGKDADEYSHTPRALLKALSQKTWYNPAVSDFAEESEVAGAASGEMARQKANALVMVKRQIERRLLSDAECSEDNGVAVPNETRGAFKWLDNGAQALYPVDAPFRTPAAQAYASTLALFTESALDAIMESIYTQRKAEGSLKGICGIKLKKAISTFTQYVPTVSNYTATRQTNLDAKGKALVNVVDRIETDAGTVDLMKSSFLLTDETTGAASAYTPRSGLFLDMDMWQLAYTRKPRIVPLEDRGGGPRAIVDAMFALICLNPLGHGKATIES